MQHPRRLLLASSFFLTACDVGEARYEFQARYGGADPSGVGAYVGHVSSDGERVFIGYPATTSPGTSASTPPRLSVMRLDDDGHGLIPLTTVAVSFNPANVVVGPEWIAVIGTANEAALIPFDADPLAVRATLGPWTTSVVSDGAFIGDSLFIRSARSVVVVDVDAAVSAPWDAESWRYVLDADDVVRAIAATPTDICTIGWSAGRRRSFRCWDAATFTQRLGISRDFQSEFEFANTLVHNAGQLYVGSPDTAVVIDLEGRRFAPDPPASLRGRLYADHRGDVWSIRQTETRSELHRLDLDQGTARRVVADLCEEARDVEVVGDHLLVACGTEGLHVYTTQ